MTHFEMADSPPRRAVRDETHDDQSLVDLDDHRLQPSSFPRTEFSPRTRRGTLASIYDNRPDLLQVDAALRDNEQAIDDSSLLGSPAIKGKEKFGRRGSVSPAIVRRGTNKTKNKAKDASRESSSSRSTSPSPPNSVHAFAESSRRRERAGTVNSKCPSVNLELQRTHSRTSNHSRHSRRSRRPTFSGRSEDGKRGTSSDSGHSSAEDDVCYPQSEDSHSDVHSIDFSDLEDFVQEEEEARETAADSSPAGPRINVETPTPNPSHQVIAVDDDFSELEKTQAMEVPIEDKSSKTDLVRRWWTFFSSELDDTIHATSIGGLLEEGETFQQLFEIRSDGGCWWLDAVNPTEDQVAALCKAFGVHPLTREDIVTQESREKVELFKKYYFVSFRSFNQDKTSEEYLEPVSVYAVVFRHGLLTFSFQQTKHTANVLKRIGRLRDYMSLSADWICYALIDDIVDSYMPIIRDVEEEADNIEDQVFAARPEDARPILLAIAECRKKAMLLMRLLGIKPDVIKGFAKRCNEGFSVAPRGDVGLYLSDIQDHVVTMRENLSHSEGLLSRLHNNFLAQINVDHISQGNSVNKVLGKVTLIATILVPLNLITGLFGMNVSLKSLKRFSFRVVC
jgi:magnesium transporter